MHSAALDFYLAISFPNYATFNHAALGKILSGLVSFLFLSSINAYIIYSPHGLFWLGPGNQILG